MQTSLRMLLGQLQATRALVRLREGSQQPIGPVARPTLLPLLPPLPQHLKRKTTMTMMSIGRAASGAAAASAR